MNKEIAHYVVTAHPPGGVLLTAKCNFLSEHSTDVLVAKSRRIEVRQLRSEAEKSTWGLPSPFPIVLQIPIHGRLTSLIPFQLPKWKKSLVFITTDRFQYAVLSHNPQVISRRRRCAAPRPAPPTSTSSRSDSLSTYSPYPIETHASGSFKGGSQDTDHHSHNLLGRPAQCGPLVAMDPQSRCIALHLQEGLLTILPIYTNYDPPAAAAAAASSSSTTTARNYKQGEEEAAGDHQEDVTVMTTRRQALLGTPFHCRLEEACILAITFLQSSNPNALPQLCVLHQDARGAQHMITHVVNLTKQQLHLFGSTSAPATTEWMKKSSVDGGSSLLIPVPPFAATMAAADPNASSSAAMPPLMMMDTSGSSSSPAPTKSSTGGVIILGQRQFTYCNTTVAKVLPVPQALFLSYETLPPDPSGMPRFLIGDEFGNLHMLTLVTVNERVVAMQFDTLGSCTLSTSLAYLGEGLVFVGSQLGDSQLIQIHDEPIAADDDEEDIDLAETTYLTVVEEYTHLGPILDFDLVPTTPGATSEAGQSQVVTASGSSKSGSLRLIRNGIGMNEYASVEIPGIQNMWSVRKSFHDKDDAYLVQSFVGETRVLGVANGGGAGDGMAGSDAEDESEEVSGTLEEVELLGLNSMVSSLYVGNVEEGDRIIQITESEIRLFSPTTGDLLSACPGSITVATANEAGQIAVAMRGGMVAYFRVQADKIVKIYEKKMDREVSCLDIHPFAPSSGHSAATAMDVDQSDKRPGAHTSRLMAVGLWDDFTVRLLSLENKLEESICISLGTEDEEMEDTVAAGSQRRNRNNMMARSLSLVTLDFSSSTIGNQTHSSSPGVDMLFAGLGDGTLISFAVGLHGDKASVRSKKVVCLGTQRIDLIPLSTERGGTCVLATGDRPTVIYLAGVGGTATNQFNPKLCYSNVNLSASENEEGDGVSRLPSQQAIVVNVAAPFNSPLLFDVGALGNQHYTLCIADDSKLRLGVIDDIQKLHVTTCRLGMAPRRIVHCIDGRLFAVGCIESGIKHFGLGGDEANMGNCIRFMDDTTFDDIERVDLEPYEMILSMVYASMKVPNSTDNESIFKPFLLVGTAYALPDEDEPTRGRILVYSFQAEESTATSNTRAVRQMTELSVQGGVYSMCQFYEGRVLCTVNSKTHLCHLVDEAGFRKLQFKGIGHHGHILSLFVKSRAKRFEAESLVRASPGATNQMSINNSQSGADKKEAVPEEMLAIVGDLMRSIGLVQYYPQHDALEEVARDFNSNWTTAVEMLNDHVYLGAENWNNLFCLRRNTASQSEEIRCRLDTIGEYHLGEMCNKFMCGSLVMPVSSSNAGSGNSATSKHRRRMAGSPQKKKAASSPGKASAGGSGRRAVVVTGSHTLFGTVDGTLGVILGLDGRTAAFFGTLERAMAQVIRPVGDLSHSRYRSVEAEHRVHPAHGFVDGDLVESFLDLDRTTMEAIVAEMNRDGGWEVDESVLRTGSATASASGGKEPGTDDGMDEDRPELTVDDVLAMVEEMAMMH